MDRKRKRKKVHHDSSESEDGGSDKEWNDHDDNDYIDFLKEFLFPGQSMEVNDDDPEADPEYNIMEDEEEHDSEEFRRDPAVKISKKEFSELLAELYDESVLAQHDTLNDDQQQMQQLPNTCFISQPAPEVCVKPQPQPIVEEKREVLITSEIEGKIRYQMQQHIQLLAQTYVLTVTSNEEALKMLAREGKKMILELQTLAVSYGPTSLFAVKNISFTSGLVNSWPTNNVSKSPIKKKILEERYKNGIVPFPGSNGHIFTKELVKVISESRAFMYPELLPRYPNLCSDQKINFTANEDALIAIGCREMQGNQYAPLQTRHKAKLIAELLLPGRPVPQIFNRIKNARKSVKLEDSKSYPSGLQVLRKYIHGGVNPPSPLDSWNPVLLETDAIAPINQPRLPSVWVSLLNKMKLDAMFKDESADTAKIRVNKNGKIIKSEQPSALISPEEFFAASKSKKVGKKPLVENHSPEQKLVIMQCNTTEVRGSDLEEFERIPVLGKNGNTAAYVVIPKRFYRISTTSSKSMSEGKDTIIGDTSVSTNSSGISRDNTVEYEALVSINTGESANCTNNDENESPEHVSSPESPSQSRSNIFTSTPVSPLPAVLEYQNVPKSAPISLPSLSENYPGALFDIHTADSCRKRVVQKSSPDRPTVLKIQQALTGESVKSVEIECRSKHCDEDSIEQEKSGISSKYNSMNESRTKGKARRKGRFSCYKSENQTHSKLISTQYRSESDKHETVKHEVVTGTENQIDFYGGKSREDHAARTWIYVRKTPTEVAATIRRKLEDSQHEETVDQAKECSRSDSHVLFASSVLSSYTSDSQNKNKLSKRRKNDVNDSIRNSGTKCRPRREAAKKVLASTTKDDTGGDQKTDNKNNNSNGNNSGSSKTNSAYPSSSSSSRYSRTAGRRERERSSRLTSNNDGGDGEDERPSRSGRSPSKRFMDDTDHHEDDTEEDEKDDQLYSPSTSSVEKKQEDASSPVHPSSSNSSKTPKKLKRSPGGSASLALSCQTKKRASKFSTAEIQMLLEAPDSEVNIEAIETAFAEEFWVKCQHTVDPVLYNNLIQVFSEFGEKYSSEEEVFTKVEEMLKDHPDLLIDLATMIEPQLLQKNNLLKDNYVVQAYIRFMHLLECPQLRAKALQKIRALRDLDKVTERDVQELVDLYFQGNPIMTDAVKAMFPHIFLPQSTIRSEDFEEVNFDESPKSEEGISSEVIHFPEETNVPATGSCPCDCHTNPKNVSFHAKARHCRKCCIKFQDGKVFMHSGRIMKQVNIEFTTREKVEEILAKKVCGHCFEPLKAEAGGSSPKRKSEREKSPRKKYLHSSRPKSGSMSFSDVDSEAEGSSCNRKPGANNPHSPTGKPNDKSTSEALQSIVMTSKVPVPVSTSKAAEDDDDLEEGEIVDDEDDDEDEDDEDEDDSEILAPAACSSRNESKDMGSSSCYKSCSRRYYYESGRNISGGAYSVGDDKQSVDSPPSPTPASASQRQKSSNVHEKSWTFEEDKTLLFTCQQETSVTTALEKISQRRQLPHRTLEQMKERFTYLVGMILKSKENEVPRQNLSNNMPSSSNLK